MATNDLSPAGQPQAPKRKARARMSRGGFVLILVVGMLSVLIVLGMSFAEQSRVDLIGAGNSRDLTITDSLAESAYQIALRIIDDDRNVPHVTNGSWNYIGTSQAQTQGMGWTSRWGYNHRINANLSQDGVNPTGAPSGAGYDVLGSGPSHNGAFGTTYSSPDAVARNFLDSWQLLIWNDEPLSTLSDRSAGQSRGNDAYRYGFKFDDGTRPLTVLQRHPVDPSAMMDTWPLQPLARVKKFRVRAGIGWGLVQISITPTDGGINLNDVFQPRTATYRATEELPGTHDTNLPEYRGTLPVTDERIKYASPDRRTLEYILGKRPTWANQVELWANETPPNNVFIAGYDAAQISSNQPAGSKYDDTGVYNFAGMTEPWGRTQWRISAHLGHYKLNNRQNYEPTTFYNSDLTYPYRYNMEAPRYIIWNPAQGMSLRMNVGGSPDDLLFTRSYFWHPTGRYKGHPAVSGSGTLGESDNIFQGFGFDLFNPMRGGVGGGQQNWFLTDVLDPARLLYNGAGMYGHPKPRSFQLHYQAAVAKGRFWSDLQANWYFGGAPGYTNYLGNNKAGTNNWAHLGSSYDSLGFGSNWFTPTQHTWLAGFKNNGRLTQSEIDRGLTRYPANMPPMKPSATYAYPWSSNATGVATSDDYLPANAHFLFGSVRNSIRAHGYQENWGLIKGSVNNQAALQDTNGRFYDAVNANLANFQTMYGLLTPEKLPSMLNRTVVAPHLHWKARILDAAYLGMEDFDRYDVSNSATQKYFDSYVSAEIRSNTTFFPLAPPPAEKVYGKLTDPRLGANGGNFTAFKAIGDNTTEISTNYIGPTDPRFSIHRAYWIGGNGKPLQSTARKPPDFIFNKMDFVTKEPEMYHVGDLSPSPGGPYVSEARLCFGTPGTPLSWTTPNTSGEAPPLNWERYRYGSGQEADDVFTDAQYDQDLSPNSLSLADTLLKSKTPPRPSAYLNWPDFFLQRTARIPRQKQHNTSPLNSNNKDIYHPLGNKGFNLNIPTAPPLGKAVKPVNGGVAINSYTNATTLIDVDGGMPVRKLHPIYGLPNPNYLLLYPASDVGYLWCDQFRRYFPVVSRTQTVRYPPNGVEVGPSPFGNLGPMPCPPLNRMKIWDKWRYSPTLTPSMVNAGTPWEFRIHPLLPVAKERDSGGNLYAPHTPGINKDEAWRITRVGRKYQEIIADEIMDYQINPWWPNPSVPLSEAGVPLDMKCYSPDTRDPAKVLLTNAFGAPVNSNSYPCWPTYQYPPVEAGRKFSVPAFYSTFNRFWVRACHKYVRESARSYNGRPWSPAPNNPVENPGLYPRAFHYFGFTQKGWDLRDHIADFPINTLDDAAGGEWRYLTAVPQLMLEDTPWPDPIAANKELFGAQLTAAPARNHPYRSWADFVAMLGHLVYRSPLRIDPAQTPASAGGGLMLKYPQGTTIPAEPDFFGVEAYTVCHGPTADPRNQSQFFDGSKIATGAQPVPTSSSVTPDDSRVLADCLRGGVVARAGFWPISGNYGEFWDPTQRKPKYIPNPPADISNSVEWTRRINELRGCEVNGLRIEQNYISERAANDVLVNLSNGRIGPIDFDGDGVISMTRKQEVLGFDDNTNRSKFWAGYPWHNETGPDATVKYRDPKLGLAPNNEYYYNGVARLYPNPNAPPGTTNETLGYGILKAAAPTAFKFAAKEDILRNCVTLPIKFRSNTFRVTVTVQMTDSQYKDVYTVRRYSRVYSRVPQAPTGSGLPFVHGPYSGEFILHSSRSTQGVDPETSLLGVGE